MSILQLPTSLPAQVGIFPSTKKMVVTDNLTTLTSAGYLNSGNLQGATIQSGDLLEVIYNATPQNFGSSIAYLTPTFNNGVITLVNATINENVQPPVTANAMAVFLNSTGTLYQPQPSSSALVNVYADALFIQGGVAGRAIISMQSAGGAGGTFAFQPTPNAGNFSYAVTNTALGQTSSVTLLDPGTPFGNIPILAWNGITQPLTTGNMLKSADTKGKLVDAGYALVAGLTSVWGGGGTSNAFTVTGLTSSSIVGQPSILSSTNLVSIQKVVPSANTLTVTFSGDPGANTQLAYIYTTAHS